tara:strand:- start:563 stop:742 length:180 start_codon:yes stop_codon:yes gene_type:complete
MAYPLDSTGYCGASSIYILAVVSLGLGMADFIPACLNSDLFASSGYTLQTPHNQRGAAI